MQFTQTIDDSNVDILARRLGWMDMVPDPNSQTPFGAKPIPNPIDQDTWIANAAVTYLNNELEAALAIPAAEAAREEAIQAAQSARALNIATVSVSSVQIKPLPPQPITL